MKKLYYLLVLITLVPLLYFRLDEGIRRLYNADEVFHLHYGYLLSIGDLPYRDFYMHFTPFFHYTLIPFFALTGENLAIYTVARLYAFVLFILTMWATYLLGKLLFRKEVGIFSALILLVIPLGIEKQIELRPDNLMIPVFITGTYFLAKGMLKGLTLRRVRPSEDFFLSGLFLGLSFWLLLKVVPGLVGLALSYLFISYWRRASLRQMGKEIITVLLGILLPTVLVLGYLLLTHNFVNGMKSIFIYAYLVQQNLWFPQNIIFYFYPNNVIYGTYQGLPWYLNNFLFVTALIAVSWFTGFAFLSRITVEKIKYFILISPLVISFLYTFFIRTSFQQYLLPIFPFMAIILAKVFWHLYSLLTRRTKLGATLYLSCLLIIFVKSGLVAWQNKRLWTNDEVLQIAREELARTGKNDRIFDFKGIYIFRRDGYYNCCNNFLEYIPELRRQMPSFVEDLEKNRTKLIVFTPGAPFDRLSPEEADYIKTYFRPTTNPMFWERAKR